MDQEAMSGGGGAQEHQRTEAQQDALLGQQLYQLALDIIVQIIFWIIDHLPDYNNLAYAVDY